MKIPARLAGRSFSTAEGIALGLTRSALDRPRFTRPYRGVRELADARVGGERRSAERAKLAAAALAPRLRPGERFSHSTALVLLGCPIRVEPRPHVTILRPGRATIASGVHGHTASEFAGEWPDPRGLPLVSPGEAFVQAASVLAFRELVVAADHLIRVGAAASPTPIIALEELRGIVASASARGVVRARAAVSFARVGAESRMETILRLLMARYRLDVLELQVNVRDAAGNWIGRFDMVDLARRLIIEYDGEQHRTDADQYEHDQERLERVRDAGYRVLRFRRRQVIDEPMRTIERIAAALELPVSPVRGRLARLFAE